MYLKQTKWYVHTCSSSFVASVIFLISFFGITRKWTGACGLMSSMAMHWKYSNQIDCNQKYLLTHCYISVYSLSNSAVDNGCMRVIILNFFAKGVKWWSWGKGMKENVTFNIYVNLRQDSFFPQRGRKRTPANFFSQATCHPPFK